MVLSKVGCRLDTIHITITRPRNIIGFVGEDGEPTDKLFYGVLDILAGKNYEVFGGSKKFVNNGIDYIQSNNKEILIQLRSAHLMKNGITKIAEILTFLETNGVKPKAKRERKKGAKTERAFLFYQISRLDFAVDYEASFDLIKILSEGIGYHRFFTGIQKDYFYRTIHDNIRLDKDQRIHRFKEMKLGNNGFELAIYSKKIEIAENATAEKLTLYPEIYREILSDKNRLLFRVELRLFRSRSIAFNSLSANELWELPKIELVRFGKTVRLLKRKKQKIIQSRLFFQLFSMADSI